VPTKILVCQRVPKKSAVLACLTMSKLKMNLRVPNNNADLLKKYQLNGNRGAHPLFSLMFLFFGDRVLVIKNSICVFTLGVLHGKAKL